MAKSPNSKPAPKPMLADQLRALIRDQGLTNYKLAGLAGVPESMVWRFMKGADLKLATAGLIADVIGAELVRTRRRPKPARAGRAAGPEDQDVQPPDDSIV